MRPNNNIVKGIFITLKNALFVKIIDFVSFYIVVHSLSKADYGDYGLIIAVFAIFSTLADMGIGNAYIKFYQNEKEKRRYTLNFLCWKFSMACVFTAVGSLFLWTLGRLWIDQELMLPLQIMGLGMLFYSLYDFMDMHYQATKQFDKKASFYTKNYMLRLVLTIVYAYLPFAKQEILFLSFYFASTALVGVFEVQKILKEQQIQRDLKKLFFPKEQWKKYLHYTKWILISTFATIFITRIDMIMIYNMRGAEENAVYSLGFQLASIVGILTSSITAVLMPHLFAGNQKEDVKNYIKSVSKYILPITGVMILGTLFTKPVLILFFGTRYVAADSVIKLLIITSAIGLYFNQINLLFYHFEKHYFITMVNYIQLLCIVILHWIVIPEYGAYGAAWNALIVRVVGYMFYIGYILFLSRRMGSKFLK